jgi:superfamily I DNA/RNA helicase
LIELANLSNDGEVKAVGDAIRDLIENKGLSEVDIAIILYNSRLKRYYSSNWKDKFYDFMSGISRYFFAQGWEQPAVLMHGSSEGATYGSRRGVTITTIEGSLGLDFRAVVLAGLLPLGIHEKTRSRSELATPTSEQLEAFKKNINFIYTGCTRAKDELIVILSAPEGESIYMDLLRQSMREVG